MLGHNPKRIHYQCLTTGNKKNKRTFKIALFNYSTLPQGNVFLEKDRYVHNDNHFHRK